VGDGQPAGQRRGGHHGAGNFADRHISICGAQGYASALAGAETPTSFITMGLHEDLNEATKLAVREMIDFLMTEKHLSRDDAYMLSSVAADLSITELVDGNKGVHMDTEGDFVAGGESEGRAWALLAVTFTGVAI